jgi:hypothetical protein
MSGPATSIGAGLRSAKVISFQPHMHKQTSNISMETPEIAHTTGDEAKMVAFVIERRLRQRANGRWSAVKPLPPAWLPKLHVVIPSGRSTAAHLKPYTPCPQFCVGTPRAPSSPKATRLGGTTSGLALLTLRPSALHERTFLEVIFSAIKTVMLLIWDLSCPLAKLALCRLVSRYANLPAASLGLSSIPSQCPRTCISRNSGWQNLDRHD